MSRSNGRVSDWEQNVAKIDEILISTRIFLLDAKKELSTYFTYKDTYKEQYKQHQKRESFLAGYRLVLKLAQDTDGLTRKFLYEQYLPLLILESFKQEIFLTIQENCWTQLGRGRKKLCEDVSSTQSLPELQKTLNKYCSLTATRFRHGVFGSLVSDLKNIDSKISAMMKKLPQLAAPAKEVSSQVSDNARRAQSPLQQHTLMKSFGTKVPPTGNDCSYGIGNYRGVVKEVSVARPSGSLHVKIATL